MADRLQYPSGFAWLCEGGNLTTATLEVALILTGSDVPTKTDAQVLSDFDSGTLLEHDGSGYVRKPLAGVAGANDYSDLRRRYVHDDIAYPAIGSASLAAIGALYYVLVTDDTDSIPISFNPSGGFPLLTDGQDWTLYGGQTFGTGFYELASREILLLAP